VQSDYLLPWNVLGGESAYQATKYWIQAKLPTNEVAPYPQCGLQTMDDARETWKNFSGAIGQTSADQLAMVKVPELSTDQWATYRSATPFIFITQRLSLNQVPPGLPSDVLCIQTKGFVKPFVYADATTDTPPLKDFRVEIISATYTPSPDTPPAPKRKKTVKGIGEKKFCVATQTWFSNPNLGEIPQYLQTRVTLPSHAVVNLRSIDRLHERVPIQWLSSPEPPLQASPDGYLNYAICLTEAMQGEEMLDPQARVIAPPRDMGNGTWIPGKINISGLRQADKLVVEAMLRGKTYEDKVAVVKGFTWNDLLRLKASGGSLTFAPVVYNGVPDTSFPIPADIQQNIINNIEFALEPPAPYVFTEQERQRVAIRQTIDDRSSAMFADMVKELAEIRLKKGETEYLKAKADYEAVIPRLATLQIPSARGVGIYALGTFLGQGSYVHEMGDMAHCHIMVPQNCPQVATTKTMWNEWQGKAGKFFYSRLGLLPSLLPENETHRQLVRELFYRDLADWDEQVPTPLLRKFREYLENSFPPDPSQVDPAKASFLLFDKNPYLVYHTYEGHLLGKAQLPNGSEADPVDYYVAPTAPQGAIIALHEKDPIRCIKAALFGNEKNYPRLFIPWQGYQPIASHEDMGKKSDEHILEMEFFINRKGQIVLIPTIFQTESPKNQIMNINTFDCQKLLEVADALEELEVR
jgi:hypothetical protein